MDEITDADIVESAKSAAEFTADGQTAKAKSVDELLKARAALAASSGSAWGKLRMARAVPPGAGPS